ncbi:hypothetical protein T439DRAFT_325213 [Meredithblackwellia eburnea MCA 4105]
MKPTIEFTDVEEYPFEELKGTEPLNASMRVLSLDEASGDKTIILYHPPGQEWGGSKGKDSPAEHDYWEECLVLKGGLFDKTLGKMFKAGSYCCRPPGMLHGPWIASEEGCEEVVFVRH